MALSENGLGRLTLKKTQPYRLAFVDEVTF